MKMTMRQIISVAIAREVAEKAVPRRRNRVVKSGTCAECGCTEQHACPGGCSWVNRGKTICSGCLERFVGARGLQLELMLARSSPALLMVALEWGKLIENLINQALNVRLAESRKRMERMTKKARKGATV